MKLLIRRRKGVFRPRLTLERASWMGGSHWQWVIWFLGGSGRLVSAGGPLVREADPTEALHDYFDFLRRLGCEPWDGVERDGRKKRHEQFLNRPHLS